MAEATNGPRMRMNPTMMATTCCNHCGGEIFCVTKTGKMPASVTMTLAMMKPGKVPTVPPTM